MGKLNRWIFLLLLSAPTVALGQNVFNCTAFASSGSCIYSTISGGTRFWGNYGQLQGSQAVLTPVNGGHSGFGMWYQTAVNVQAFTTTFTFEPDQYNFVFALSNSNNAGGSGSTLTAGAGGEAGFTQFAGGSNTQPNFTFGLEFDQDSESTQGGSFTYSTVTPYGPFMYPVLPIGGNLQTFPTNKLSTSPVPMNSPHNTGDTCVQTVSGTCDTFSATITYNSGNLSLSLCFYDVTAANGSCSSATIGTGTYFTNTWTGINLPGIVGATTAFVGFTAGLSGSGNPFPNLVDSWQYTVNTPSGSPSFTTWNANSTYNNGTISSASPVYSVAPGSYSGTQTVSITTSTTPGNYICYTLSSTTPTIYPQADMNGGCSAGSLYTGPISISSTATLYAQAASNNSYFPGKVNPAPAGIGPVSTLVAGTYTISSGSPAAAPTFSPVAGTYSSPQLVTASTTTSGCGPYIYFDTNTTPVTNQTTLSVATSETVYAYVHGCPGYADSSISSAAYTITPPTANPVITLASGAYTLPTTTTITDSTGGAVISYCTTAYGGSCAPSTTYSTALTISSPETICANALASGHSQSSTVCNNYANTIPFNIQIGGNLRIAGSVIIQ